jgi:hypothetical protein
MKFKKTTAYEFLKGNLNENLTKNEIPEIISLKKKDMINLLNKYAKRRIKEDYILHRFKKIRKKFHRNFI